MIPHSRLQARLNRVNAATVKLVLVHRTIDGATVVFETEKTDDSGTQAQCLLDAAKDYVEDTGVRCDLAVVAMGADGRQLNTIPFKGDPDIETPEGQLGASDLTPSIQGVVTQLMRHNEVQQRLLLNNLANLLNHYRDALTARDQRVKELEERERHDRRKKQSTDDVESELKADLAKRAGEAFIPLIPKIGEAATDYFNSKSNGAAASPASSPTDGGSA